MNQLGLDTHEYNTGVKLLALEGAAVSLLIVAEGLRSGLC
jgi:hypothetical protein